MKTKLIIASCVIALSASTAYAAKPNNNGCGGQMTSDIASMTKDFGTNWGQFKKGFIGGNAPAGPWGQIVSDINKSCGD